MIQNKNNTFKFHYNYNFHSTSAVGNAYTLWTYPII